MAEIFKQSTDSYFDVTYCSVTIVMYIRNRGWKGEAEREK